MATQCPTVNKNLEVIIASRAKNYLLNAEFPETDGCPVSLPELGQFFKEYGPRNTNALGHKIENQKGKQPCLSSTGTQPL